MTIIAFKGGVCSWDSQVTNGAMKSGLKFKKVVPITSTSGMFAGGCGSCGEVQKWQRFMNSMDSETLAEWLLEPHYPNKSPNTILWAWNGHTGYLLEIYNKPWSAASFTVPAAGHAIGTGDEYAMGAMAMGASPVEAVALVCKKFDGCGPPINKVEVQQAAKSRKGK